MGRLVADAATHGQLDKLRPLFLSQSSKPKKRAASSTLLRSETFAERIAAQSSLMRYHFLQISPMPPELHYFIKRKLRSAASDNALDIGKLAPLEDVIPDPYYTAQWKALFAGSYRGDLILMNLLGNNEGLPAGPDDPSAEELQERYTEKAMQVLGKLVSRFPEWAALTVLSSDRRPAGMTRTA